MKKTIAVILELIPIVSAVLFYVLTVSHLNSDAVKTVISITCVLALLGFVFFFIGHRIAKGEAAVTVLGILDWLATVFVIAFYVIAVFNFGL